jgi:GTPase
VALNKIDRLFPNLVRNGRQASTATVQPELDTDSISAKIVADLGLGPDYIPISAQQGWGLDNLLKAVQDTLGVGLVALKALIPYKNSDLVALFHEKGIITTEEHVEQGTLIDGRLPKRYAEVFRPFAG